MTATALIGARILAADGWRDGHALLVEAGLLAREKRGKWAWYRLVPERMALLRNALAP